MLNEGEKEVFKDYWTYLRELREVCRDGGDVTKVNMSRKVKE